MVMLKNCCCFINLIFINFFLIYNMVVFKWVFFFLFVLLELIMGLGFGLVFWIFILFGDLDFNIFYVYICIYGKECCLVS